MKPLIGEIQEGYSAWCASGQSPTSPLVPPTPHVLLSGILPMYSVRKTDAVYRLQKQIFIIHFSIAPRFHLTCHVHRDSQSNGSVGRAATGISSTMLTVQCY
jgi:hypothetical protein